MLPVYPVLAGFTSAATEYDFYRGFIDESSIIDSYFGDTNIIGDGTLFIESRDSFLQVNTSSTSSGNTTRASRTIIEHEVLGGESLGTIASAYGVSVDTIRWENNLSGDGIRPGQVLRILPASGLSHKVTSGETLSGLAQKYKVSQEDIMRQNLLLSASDLKIGDNIIIPGAKREPPKPAPVPQPQRTATRAVASTTSNTNSGGHSFVAQAASENVNTQGRYQLVWRQPQWTFYWGNCTWYVAQYKNVNWSGNANQWLNNARAKGHATGNTPTLGAIVQLGGRGYNPRYGHVGIVIDFTDTHIVVSDMNYRRLGEVTTRQIPRNDTAIQGYIYVD
ncbi:LysM peptidoglycan-binding domain-containing protein [Candidatus Gracilibacteria bacterium]|nr:LysM peptidoglycan-binding domain-containing protein [Candidatus Gracilibacteria bacterium]